MGKNQGGITEKIVMRIQWLKYALISTIIIGVIGMCVDFSNSDDSNYKQKREEMVSMQIMRRGVSDERVLNAMRTVERHLFVPEHQMPFAYEDYPLPIGYNQTISQPYIVALMTELLKLEGNDTVLEVGTGSGYQAAVLAEIGCKVYTIEIVPELAESARINLEKRGYINIKVKAGDGYKGWEEYAPFDAIIITAAAEEVPPPLIEQLREGGRMVVPVDVDFGYQMLKVISKGENGNIHEKDTIPVRFVPLVRKK